MNQKIKRLYEQWDNISTKLMNSKEELIKFFKFSSKMYKMRFSDAALLYSQNPNIEKAADLKTWNKLGRYVNKGEHGIEVFGRDKKGSYLFDINQTHGKSIPEIWKLKSDIVKDVLNHINKKSSNNYDSIEKVISSLSRRTVNDHFDNIKLVIDKKDLTLEQGERYYNSIISVVKFIAARRCELNSDIEINQSIDLSALDDMTSLADFRHFCDFAQKSAQVTILSLEHDIIEVIKNKEEKEHERYELRNEFRRGISGTGLYGRSGGTGITGETYRQMGQNVAEMDRNRISVFGSGLRDGVPLADNSERSGYRSGEEMGRTGRDIPSEESTSYDISGDTEMGKRTFVDSRASGNGGSSFQNEKQQQKRTRTDEKTTRTEQITNLNQDLSSKGNPDFSVLPEKALPNRWMKL